MNNNFDVIHQNVLNNCQQLEENVYAYHYLPESVYEQIKEDKVIKSACMIFLLLS